MHRLKLVALAATFSAVASSMAFAHAFLDSAVPGVGSTVGGSPGELTLSFTQKVVVALAKVQVAGPGGSVAAGKPSGDSSSSEVLHVRLGRALPPGTYVVTWHVVSVDTHPTSGTYKFNVAP